MPSYTESELRLLDAKVAELRGWRPYPSKIDGGWLNPQKVWQEWCPNPATSISDAAELDGMEWIQRKWGNPGGFLAAYSAAIPPGTGYGEAESEALSRTLAYLRAHGVDPDEVVKGGK